MAPAEYILISAAVVVPLIALHHKAIEVVYILGQMSAAMIGAPW